MELPPATVLEMKSTNLPITHIVDITKGHASNPILEMNFANMTPSDALAFQHLDFVSVLVVDSHMDLNVIFVATKRKCKGIWET